MAVKYRVLYPRRGYKVGQIIEPPESNISVWEAREWAERIGSKPKVEAAVEGPAENAAERVGKPVEYRGGEGGWYELLDADGEVVRKVRGEDAAKAAVGSD